MIIELNEEHLDVLRDALLVNRRRTKEELEMWTKRHYDELAEDCKRRLEIIREIEDKIN